MDRMQLIDELQLISCSCSMGRPAQQYSRARQWLAKGTAQHHAFRPGELPCGL